MDKYLLGGSTVVRSPPKSPKTARNLKSQVVDCPICPARIRLDWIGLHIETEHSETPVQRTPSNPPLFPVPEPAVPEPVLPLARPVTPISRSAALTTPVSEEGDGEGARTAAISSVSPQDSERRKRQREIVEDEEGDEVAPNHATPALRKINTSPPAMTASAQESLHRFFGGEDLGTPRYFCLEWPSRRCYFSFTKPEFEVKFTSEFIWRGEGRPLSLCCNVTGAQTPVLPLPGATIQVQNISFLKSHLQVRPLVPLMLSCLPPTPPPHPPILFFE